MTKQLLLILFFAFSITVFSQEVERIKISGKISASKGEDVEGINIYNNSSQIGTITSITGEFEISVAENDRLFFSAMQFQNFTVIIDQGILESKSMHIMLNPVINQLDEVLIRPYDLSGNIVADVKRINVTSVSNEFDLSYKTMEFEYEFAPDDQTSIKKNMAEDAYYNGRQQVGGDVIGLLSTIVGAVLVGKANINVKNGKVSEKELVTKEMQRRLGIGYISETFNIPEEKVNEFIYFVEENGMDKKLLKPENELLLFEYLDQQSKLYLKQIDEK